MTGPQAIMEKRMIAVFDVLKRKKIDRDTLPISIPIELAVFKKDNSREVDLISPSEYSELNAMEIGGYPILKKARSATNINRIT